MGRLIDENELIGILGFENTQEEREENVGEIITLEDIDRIPTAYNPDKVVNQLEERTAFLKDCKKYDNETVGQQEKSYETMMMYEVKDLVDDLIEIVRGGGVDA